MKNSLYNHNANKRVCFPALLCLLFILAGLSSCKKYLSAKPDKTLVTPSTFEDLQSLLDADYIMNTNHPVAGQLACDDYYLIQQDYEALSDLTGIGDYIWDKDAQNDHDWQYSYTRIFNSNIVLKNEDGIAHEGHPAPDWQRLRGSALFFRSVAFFELAQVFTLPYDKETAATTMGIPLKTDPDITDATLRSNLQETYDKITGDLKEAAALLPENTNIKTRPSKAAAFGELARVYLTMNDYDDAGKYADSFLILHPALMDFNDLDATALHPVSRFNEEVVFHSGMSSSGNLYPGTSKPDSTVFNSYADDDLRKQIFFDLSGDYPAFRGDYGGGYYGNLFNGIATDEIMLIQAECKARQNKTEEALHALNSLLEKRWKAGTFAYYHDLDNETLLEIILKERRKELIYRGGLRWLDLRRLNTEGKYITTLKRVIGDKTYVLEPGDKRYAFLLPVSVVQLAGVAQNER